MTRDNDRSAERRDAPAARPEGQERDGAPAPGRPEDIAARLAEIADLLRRWHDPAPEYFEGAKETAEMMAFGVAACTEIPTLLSQIADLDEKGRRMLEGVDLLARVCALRDQQIRDLEDALASIRRRAASNPTRTFDDAIYDLSWIADETVAALARHKERTS